MAPILEVRDLAVRFGGVVALDRVSFKVDEGQVVGLIGPNGAGKTTLFNIITRVYRPAAGTVVVDGKPVEKMAPHEVVRNGVARTFQNLALFRSMTVLDNVLVGDHIRTRSGWLEASLPLPWALSAEAASRKRALEILEFVGLSKLASHPVAVLPFGTSNYNSLQLQLNKRMARGLSFGASYTLSKLMEATSYLNDNDASSSSGVVTGAVVHDASGVVDHVSVAISCELRAGCWIEAELFASLVGIVVSLNDQVHLLPDEHVEESHSHRACGVAAAYAELVCRDNHPAYPIRSSVVDRVGGPIEVRVVGEVLPAAVLIGAGLACLRTAVR